MPHSTVVGKKTSGAVLRAQW